METQIVDKQWWLGFQKEYNFSLENGTLTVKIYDPPEYSLKEVDVVLNPWTPFGHELSHILAGAFYFKGFDPSGSYLWGQKITDDFDPGRSLFYECWVIHGQIISDPNLDRKFVLEHHKQGKEFLEETYSFLYNTPIPAKWIERWDKLKDQIDELAEFRKELTVNPWHPIGFSKIKLARI